MGDGLLSVLPLHHTFEFSAGLLTPFSRGAEVTYLDELTTDRLGEVLESGHVTAMIGVPALWTLFHRKITQELAAKPAIVEQGMRALMSAHGALRNRKNINLGKLLFWPVHRRFGGRIKFLVSGGSALAGRGAPAPSTSWASTWPRATGSPRPRRCSASRRPGNKRVAGSVGKALPGIELRIESPDNEGIGEVCARGPNVMAGYFADREATDATPPRTAGCTPETSGGSTPRGSSTWWAGRRTSSSTPTGRTCTRTSSRSSTASTASIKELSVVGLPDEAGGETVACLCVPGLRGAAPGGGPGGAGGALPPRLRRAPLPPADEGAALLGRASSPGPAPAR